jgi:hypothetical protein
MHIISTTDLEVKVVPRQFPTGDLTVKITNEETKSASTITVTTYTKTDNDITFDLTGTFKEAEFSTFRVLEGSTELYRGKIFCTDQTDYTKYSTIENAYTEKESSTNGYLFR